MNAIASEPDREFVRSDDAGLESRRRQVSAPVNGCRGHPGRTRMERGLANRGLRSAHSENEQNEAGA